MKKKKSYYYLSFDSIGWVLISLIASIGSFVIGCLTGGVNWGWISSMLLFLFGIAAIIIPPLVSNGKAINEAYKDGLLDKAISEAIEAAKMQKGKEYHIKKYEHYLHKIIQADKLNPIQLNIDDKKFDNLFTLKGALSITNAPLVAWKDPEYNWFLVANYMATLIKRQQSPTKLEIKDRKTSDFRDFIETGERILADISNVCFNYDENVRFYIISESDIKENKAMIEQMIAGHELFGIHLFIIDPAIFKCVVRIEGETKTLYDLYQKVVANKTITDNQDVLDIMIYKDEKDDIMVKYPSEGILKERYYTEIESDCNNFTKALAENIKGNSAYRIYPINSNKTKIDIDGIQIDLNSNYTYCNI